jgi:hypothetical protein
MVRLLIIASITMFGLLAVVQETEGAKLVTTIEIAEQTEDTVTFTVTRNQPYDKGTIWVTNKCWDADGNLVERQNNPVLWGTTESLVGTTWPFPVSGETCTAYVTLRPWQKKPHNAPEVTFDAT